MSNHLGIGAVTAAIKHLIQQSVTRDVTGGTVTVGSPADVDPVAGAPCVNLFLYRVTPNAELRNSWSPTRPSNGVGVRQRPTAAVDLHYLLTFHGDHAELEPERLMGSTLIALETHPILTEADINDGVSAYATASPDPLSGQDLSRQVDRVRLTQASLTVEELANLWTSFPETHYRVALIYTASVVLLEAQVSSRRALPVQQAAIYVRTLRTPRLSTVSHEDGDTLPLEVDSNVVFGGVNLRGERTWVLIDDQEAQPAASALRATEITMNLGAFDIRAGIRVARVEHRLYLEQVDGSSEERRGFVSNAVPFVLHPRIAIGTGSSAVLSPATSPETYEVTVNLTVQPDVYDDQDVRLLLNATTSGGQDYTAQPVAFTGGTSSLQFLLPSMEAGTYLARLVVDGAESALEIGATQLEYTTPTVVVP